MKWDSELRAYVDDDGFEVSPVELRDRIEKYIASQKGEVEDKAHDLILGTITAAGFFSWFRSKIAEVHGAAGLVAYGGEDEMNPERWVRIGEKIASEVAYAEAFEAAFVESEAIAEMIVAEVVELGVSSEKAAGIVRTTFPASDIPRVLDLPDDAFGDRLENLIFGQTEARSTLYMDSIYSTHENSVRAREGDAGVLSGRRVSEEDANVCDGCLAAATDEYLPLDEILDIGDAECMSNCRCIIEFNYAGIEPIEIDRSFAEAVV